MSKCKVCAKPLIQREHESKNRFAKKKFCSNQCAKQYFKENKIGWWSPENKKMRGQTISESSQI